MSASNVNDASNRVFADLTSIILSDESASTCLLTDTALDDLAQNAEIDDTVILSLLTYFATVAKDHPEHPVRVAVLSPGLSNGVFLITVRRRRMPRPQADLSTEDIAHVEIFGCRTDLDLLLMPLIADRHWTLAT